MLEISSKYTYNSNKYHPVCFGISWVFHLFLFLSPLIFHTNSDISKFLFIGPPDRSLVCFKLRYDNIYYHNSKNINFVWPTEYHAYAYYGNVHRSEKRMNFSFLISARGRIKIGIGNSDILCSAL